MWIDCSYLRPVFDKECFDTILAGAVQKLTELDATTSFEAIAFSGMSGAALGFALAHQLGKQPVLVRKEVDNCHSMRRVEGRGGSPKTAIFLDDLIDSGATYVYVRDCLTKFEIKLVGLCLYRDSRKNYDGLPCVSVSY